MVFVRLDLTVEPNNLTYMYSHLYLRIKSNYRILLNGTYVIYIYNIFWVIKNFWFWHLTQRTRHTCILILYLRINSHFRIHVLSNGTYIYTYFWYNISKLLAFGGILLHTIVNYDNMMLSSDSSQRLSNRKHVLFLCELNWLILLRH